MANKVIINAFMTLIKQLNEELIKMYPEDINFKMSKTTVQMCEKTNTTKQLVDNMGQYLCLYSKYILNKDEQFFLNKDISDYDNDDIVIMNKLKQYWLTFSNEEKDHVWTYLQNLLKLYTKLIDK